MKKIMFNDRYGLTKAVLEGRKTMTRRIVKLENISCIRCINANYEDYYLADLTDGDIDEIKPEYSLGEIVSVAQCYAEVHNAEPTYELQYALDNFILSYHKPKSKKLQDVPGWKNKMFVRADLMPYQIRIKNIKVERLQDITDEECFKEGINTLVQGKIGVGNGYGWDVESDAYDRETYLDPKSAFADLIDKVSGKGTWAMNPFVWVYEFELIR